MNEFYVILVFKTDRTMTEGEVSESLSGTWAGACDECAIIEVKAVIPRSGTAGR